MEIWLLLFYFLYGKEMQNPMMMMMTLLYLYLLELAILIHFV